MTVRSVVLRLVAPLMLAVAIVWAAACSTGGSAQRSDLAGPQPGASGSGTVGVALSLFNGANLTSINWTISGPSSYSGSVMIGSAQSLEFVAGGIAAGSGYTITLTGSDSFNDPCSGTSAPFTVVAGAVVYTLVSVVCLEPNDATVSPDVVTGSLAVEAGVVVVVAPPSPCPGISSFSISPAEVEIGQPSALGVSTIGPPSTIAWAFSPATGANLANSTTDNPTFTCTVPGQYTVTAIVSSPDAACAGQPFTTYSGLINCEPACNTASDCTGMSTTCMPMACIGGLCTTQTATEGTPCSDAGISQICNGAGSCVPFTFEVVRMGPSDGGGGALIQATRSAPVSIELRNVTDGGLAAAPNTLPVAASGANMPFTLPLASLGVALSRSTNGHYLSLVGYGIGGNQSDPTINNPDGVVVARISSDGGVDTETQVRSGMTGPFLANTNSLRTAVSADGTAFWVGGVGSGGTGGTWYVPFASTNAGAQLSATSIRGLGIFGGQLYATSEQDSGMPVLATVGSGLPTTGPQSLVGLPGLPLEVQGSGASAWQFVFLSMTTIPVPGLNTVYIANDTTINDAGVMMGIQRWTFNGSVWSETGTLTYPNATSPVGFRGLTGIMVGSQAVLIGTTAETANHIVLFTDDGMETSWAPTVLAVAPTGGSSVEYFRGTALPPH